MVWDEVKGVRNRNSELIGLRHPLKKFINSILGIKIPAYLNYANAKKTLKKESKKTIAKKQLQKCGKIALIFMGTQKYVKFFPRYYASIKKNFLPDVKKDFYILTDQIDYLPIQKKKDVFIRKIKHENTSFSTLFRFKYVNNLTKELKKYSHIIYIDVDIYAKNLVLKEEFFCHNKSLFGVQHPNFVNKRGQFEFDPRSKASVNEKNDLSTYWQCSFWGGKSKEILKMCKELNKRINLDLKNKIIAIWLDESHLNKYFVENKKKVHTYSPSYTYPGLWPRLRGYKRRLIHDKGNVLK